MNWLLVVVAVVLAFVYAFVSRKVQEKRDLLSKVQEQPELRVKVRKARVKSQVLQEKQVFEKVKFSEYRSMSVGASQMADGGLLLLKGCFRLCAFVFCMVGDVVKTGYRWVSAPKVKVKKG